MVEVVLPNENLLVLAFSRRHTVKLEIDGDGVRFTFKWDVAKAAVKQLLVLFAMLLAWLAAPELARLLAILGW
jgi:hypothetical protein